MVGDSEAVQDILTGGRKKAIEEHKEAQDGDDDAGEGAVVVEAAARVLDAGSDESDVEDGLVGTSRGKRQMQASVDRVFGSSMVANKTAAVPDSDDDNDDMVVVKG